MTDKKEEQIKIAVNTFNWGPCVTRFKIQDDFKKVLLDEAKKSEIDFKDRLAGQIEKERGYSEKQRDIIIPYLSPYLGINLGSFSSPTYKFQALVI